MALGLSFFMDLARQIWNCFEEMTKGSVHDFAEKLISDYCFFNVVFPWHISP